ncbi:unnamed protein product, partial [Iphiclides podalirius]
MDCCNYGEYRHAHGQYAWDGYGYALPYAPYAHGYYAPHAHDPYARYYRYDYPAPHTHHNEHPMPMDYGAYSTKESRGRRTLSRRDQRSHPPAHHLPHPHTSSSECGVTGRRSGYCETQMWPHYQMGVLAGGGWSATNAAGSMWASRGMCSREQVRYMPSDCRMIKSSQISHPNQLCAPDGRSTPFPVYENGSYASDNGKHSCAVEVTAKSVTQSEIARPVRERIFSEPQRGPSEEKRPPVVPLPAFQQAFGSTEIGKFAEAFSRAEVAHEAEDISNDNFTFESFQDWEGAAEWSSPPANREIKCEENY